MTTGDPGQLVSLREAARLIGVHHSTLARAVKRGALRQAGVTPGGWARFLRSDVESLVASGMTGGGSRAAAPARRPDAILTGTVGPGATGDGDALSRLPDLARRTVGADFAAVTVLGPDGRVEEMHYSGMTADQAAKIGSPPVGRGVLGALGPAGAPLRLGRVADDPRSVGFPPGHPPMGPLLGVRVVSGSMRANLYLANGPDGKQFTDRDELLVTALAEYARVALANEELLNRERVLRSAEELTRRKLEAVIHNSAAGVLFLEFPSRRVLATNSAVTRLTGVEFVVGETADPDRMPFTMLTHDGRLLSQDETPFMRASATRGAIAPTEITLVNRDGSRMPVLCSAAPVLGEAGTVVSVVLVLQDLSNLKQIEQVRADFFSMVTHDLKTPVSTIKGIARAAQGESNDPSVATYFDAIDEEADHLTELISNFLDMSRIEAGAGILDPETCHIADLVDDAVRRARRGRPGAGRTIETDVYPGLPALYADPAQIGRVLDNLVSNGLKYSDGPLTVRAYADGGRVVTEVIDRGVGVPAEHMSDVFSKFFRVKRSDRRGREGAGLGLAICKAIVEAHRGEIGVRSKEREGSTFWFTLPEDTGKPA